MSKTYTPHREKDGIRKGLWDIMGPPAPPFFFLRGGVGGGGGGGGGAMAEILIVSIVLIGFYKICVKCFAKPLLQW